jgi:SSS family solute:Na+ symporter
MMPLIVVLPGIAAYVLYKNGGLQTEMTVQMASSAAIMLIQRDLGFLPTGLRGLSMAALTAGYCSFTCR